MRLTERFAAELRRHAKVVLLTVLMIVSFRGWADGVVDALGRGRVAAANQAFLEEASEEGVKRLIALSLIKDALALIGSSRVGISFIVDAEVELGQILESLRALYERAWQSSVIGLGTLYGLRIALDLAVKLAPRLLAVFFGLMIVHVLVGHHLPRIRHITRDLALFGFALMLLAHAILPLTVFGTSLATTHFTAPIARKANHQMVTAHQQLSGAFEDQQLKGRAKSALEHYRTSTHGLKSKIENLARNATQHMVVVFFEAVVFPLGVFHLLCSLARLLVRAWRERQQLDAALDREERAVAARAAARRAAPAAASAGE